MGPRGDRAAARAIRLARRRTTTHEPQPSSRRPRDAYGALGLALRRARGRCSRLGRAQRRLQEVGRGARGARSGPRRRSTSSARPAGPSEARAELARVGARRRRGGRRADADRAPRRRARRRGAREQGDRAARSSSRCNTVEFHLSKTRTRSSASARARSSPRGSRRPTEATPTGPARMQEPHGVCARKTGQSEFRPRRGAPVPSRRMAEFLVELYVSRTGRRRRARDAGVPRAAAAELTAEGRRSGSCARSSSPRTRRASSSSRRSGRRRSTRPRGARSSRSSTSPRPPATPTTRPWRTEMT